MNLEETPCGCLTEAGTGACPHCGRVIHGNHIRRCHQRSIGAIPRGAHKITAMDIIRRKLARKG